MGYAENDPGKTVRPVESYGFEEGYLETLNITWADSERGQGPTGTAIRTGQVTLCRHMLTDPRFAPWREEALRRGYAASIVFPLMDNGRAFGAISIYSREPDPFSDAEIQLLEQLANDLAYGILSLRARATQEKASQALLESQQNQARIEVQHRLLEQREQERLQIARDIHDGPVQELTAASLTLQGMLLDGPAQQQTDTLEGLLNNLQVAISELRDYAQFLRPPVLSRFGLEKAIHAHLDDFRAKHPDLVIDFTAEPDGDRLPEAMRIALYRIYQESLNNIVKHAQAHRIQIRLILNTQDVVLEIQDNGKGFEIPGDWLGLARQRHLGLVGMRERAEAVGGALQVSSRPGEGTRIRVIIPQ
jgi:signal transduction histidine kinase